MANTKRYVIGHKTVGPDPTVVIQRDADGYFWDDGVGFIANGGTPVYNAMTEAFTDFWVYETNYEVWDNGLYNVLIVDGLPEPLGAYSETISGDTQIGFIEASSITSKNAVTALRADLQALQAIVTKMETGIGVLSDRIDSFQQTLARMDYKTTTE